VATAVAALIAVAPVAAAAHQGGSDPAHYRFVEPPAEVRAPLRAPVTRDVVLDRSRMAGPWTVWTEDLQAVVTLPDAAVVGGRRWDVVRAVIEPLAPRSLPALPLGQQANGNAVRVALTDPAGRPVDGPIVVHLVAPWPSEGVWRRDGGAWSPVEVVAGRGGYDLTVPATSVLLADRPRSGSPNTSSTLAIAVVAGPSLFIGFIVLVVRVRRRNASPPPR
jgi:hypothetical protein